MHHFNVNGLSDLYFV